MTSHFEGMSRLPEQRSAGVCSKITYSAQQDSMREANTGGASWGIESLLFWKATAPTT